MLDLMRAHSRSFVIYLLFGIIIIVFIVSFGPGAVRFDNEAKYAVRVNGRVLTENDYRLELQQIYNYWESRFGDQFTSEMADRMGLKTQALENLVQNALLVEEARRLGLAASDDDVLEEIRTMPWFREEGHFSYDLFQRRVNHGFRTTPSRYKERVRDELLARRMRGILAGAVRVSAAELKKSYEWENDKAELEYLQFDPGKYKGTVSIDDAEIKSFVKEQRARVDEFYKNHERRYKRPKASRVRRLLFEIKQDASDAGKRRTRRKLEKLRRQIIEEGGDFAELAKEHSDGPKKSLGGDLGFIEPGTMEPEFDKIVFALQEGGVSEIFETPFGLNLVKIESLREPLDKKIDDVAEEIAGELLTEDRAGKLGREAAEEALKQVLAGTSFETLAQEELEEAEKSPTAPKKGLTGPFGRSRDSLPWIGKSEVLLRKAFKLDAGTLDPNVHEVDGKFYIVRVREHTPPDWDEFAEQHDRLESKLRDDKRRRVLADWIKRARARATIETTAAYALQETEEG